MSLGLKPFVGRAAEAYGSDLARLNLWDGAVRSGKTINSILRWAKWVREEAPSGTLMMVGKTERTIRQNVVLPIMEIFGDYAKYSLGNHELSLFGRKHIIIGANDERAEAKIRGITLAGMYGDEVTLWPESFFQMALTRLSVEGAVFLGTTNPDAPSHWLNTNYLERAGELGLKRHVFRLHDNPNLPAKYVSDLKKEFTGLWYKRFILGEWCVAEGAVYDMLDPDRHVVADLPFDLTDVMKLPLGTWAGGDYGTTNPTVFLCLSQSKRAFYVHHEYRFDSAKAQRQKTNKEYSDDWFAWKKEHGYPIQRLYLDPAANSFRLQLWRDGEKRLVAANNDVLDGIRETAALLGADLLRFHAPTTLDLWTEMTSYVWDSKAQNKGQDAPLKMNDHGPDALRYAVRGTRSAWKRLLAQENT